MERNQKSTLVLCGCVTAALIILLVLSLLAPHGYPERKCICDSGRKSTGRQLRYSFTGS